MSRGHTRVEIYDGTRARTDALLAGTTKSAVTSVVARNAPQLDIIRRPDMTHRRRSTNVPSVGSRQGPSINNFVRAFCDPDAFAASRNAEARNVPQTIESTVGGFPSSTLGGELRLMTQLPAGSYVVRTEQFLCADARSVNVSDRPNAAGRAWSIVID